MQIELNPEQRAQLELISMHAGKPAAQVLTETARFLLDRDVEFWDSIQRGEVQPGSQTFLHEADLDARLAQMLRR
jgi:hypothetical protein